LKLLILCLFTVAMFASDDLLWIGSGFALVLGLYVAGGRRFFLAGLRSLRPLWPFLVILALWHGIGGDWSAGVVVALRLLAAVGLANLVTMTTPLSQMIGVLRWVATPFRMIGISTRPLEIAIAMVIRFTPVLIGKGGQLAEAWRARSTKRAGWHLIIPFGLIALDDAEQIAEALRARGGVQES